MKKLLVAVYFLLFAGCGAVFLPRAYAAISSGSQFNRNSLSDVTEFNDFKVGMSEDELKSVVNKQQLLSKYYEIQGRSFFHVYRADGENIMVIFRSEQCSKILRMPVDPYCGLYFLAETPEFQALTLTTSESSLTDIAEQNQLLKIVSGTREMRIFRIYRSDGENIIVKFRYGKCAGVQKMPRDSETVALAAK